MAVLESFKPFNFEEGVPYVSVTNNGITFNKSVVMKLGYPEYVVLLIDEKTSRIAVQVCEKETANSVQFYREKKSKVISVRWNGKDLLNTISSMTSWDLSKAGYRATGVLLKDENAMLFDLKEATVLAPVSN